MCCSTEQCIVDRVQSMYLDKPPFRSGMCCVCVPCTCCGPPVIFSKTPKCCCVDTTDCFGQQVPAYTYASRLLVTMPPTVLPVATYLLL